MDTMRKISIYLIGLLLFITSCAPKTKENEVIQKEDEQTNQEISIVPNYQLSSASYRMVLPLGPGKARGVIVNQIGNRLDINEIEDGLRRHSTEVFDPKKLFFDEGQYLTSDTVYKWLGRGLTEEQFDEAFDAEVARRKKAKIIINEETIKSNLRIGLNPAIKDTSKKEEQEKNPRYLSHILEQNFLKINEDNTEELVGVSIALALKSVYHYQTENDGPTYSFEIPLDDMLEKGKQMAQVVLERLRKTDGIEGVPVMIALYREEDRTSPIPGNFIVKTTVPANDMLIGDWKNIDEEYVLFPSEYAKKEYFDDYEIVKSFGKDISTYFPNYVGYVGEGFYVNEELKKLSIEVPMEFNGSAEVVGFTQYIYGIVKSKFPNRYDLEIIVTSSLKTESVIYRNAEEEDPTVHVFH